MSRVQKFFKIFGWSLFIAVATVGISAGTIALLETLRAILGFAGAVAAFVLILCLLIGLIGAAVDK